MKRTAIIALTENGRQLANRLLSWEPECDIYVPERLQQKEQCFTAGSFQSSMKQLFAEYEALICIMAAGIVVRSIASLINDKQKDPAVLVIDEKGQFVISLLAGHIGGANQLTRQLAAFLAAVPVITTATDVQEVTAIDLLALSVNGWYKEFKETTKRINGLLAAHQQVGLIDQNHMIKDQRGLTVLPELPENLESFAAVIWVTADSCSQLPDKVIQVVPRVHVLGIGCRKETSYDLIQQELTRFCQQERIHPRSIGKLASIDLKKQEKGIHQLALALDVPFEAYTAENLAAAAEKYPQSDFVKSVTGIGSIAQAAADFGGNGKVYSKRYARHGITFALGKLENGKGETACYM